MAATIFGTVYDTGTTVLTAATVSCPGRIVTNNSGGYSMTVPGAGTYTLTASCVNYNPQAIQVQVINGQTKLQDFHLSHV
ncbi:MAG: carboxypeptidase-like regulatory domain-containing protein [Planctomycetes bacterium]|nr:carboxypeptidase-like regulatory domain-containing protein [Planctomycetota bacterium]